MEIPTDCLYPVQAAMEQWSDSRVIGSMDLENLLLFVVYGPKVLSQFGHRWCGFSCRQKHTQTLLTVKTISEGTPLVAFITSDTTTGCIVRFWDLLEQDRVTWVKDRYPWN